MLTCTQSYFMLQLISSQYLSHPSHKTKFISAFKTLSRTLLMMVF